MTIITQIAQLFLITLASHYFVFQVEYPIPEQFRTTYNGKGLTTVVSDIA